MNMTLGQKQRAFAKLVPRLIDKAHELGFEVTLGDAYRDPRVHGNVGEKKSYSSANSVHKSRLAIDLNLFRDGVYLTSSEDYKELGQWWEKQHEYARNGYSFNDANHFSFEHQGRK